MTTSVETPRSLTQMLREREDSVLVRMLLDRPDLAFPHPTDLSEVASRATTRHSVTASLSVLNALELWVATLSASMSAPFAVADLPSDGADPVAVRAAVSRLVDLGLVWGHPTELTALRPVRAMSAMLENTVPGPPPAAIPPVLAYEHRSPPLTDKVAAGSAFELVRRMDVMIEHCDHQPPVLRRTGQMSTRDLRAFAGLLDVSSATTTTLFELAMLSGLVGLGSDTLREVVLPTKSFDDWQTLPLADQWAVLVRTWVTRHSESGAPWLKHLVLEAFGDPDEGHVVSVDDVRRWVAWHRPRRPPRTDKTVSTMLEQAGWMGVMGMGAVATFAPDVDARQLDALLPHRVNHVLIQADLTAVAPGPLTSEAAHDLGTLADVESRGGATVYRISPESLKRAHRLGWSVAEIMAALHKRSRTPLPQALEYLVNDLDRTASTNQSRGPAFPTHREPQRGTAVGFDALVPGDRLDAALAAELIAALRVHSEPEAGGRDTKETGEALFDSPLATLREAVETGEIVWVGYVDPVGTAGERLVFARILEDGVLTAQDSRSQEQISLAVHRITAAHIIRDAS